jgi:Na+-translocating ferredoxin:NAD+ oxidoreductase RnfG subunit
VIKNDYLSPFAFQNVDQITVDSSTGATYTYTSVTKIVQNAADYFLENRGELHD